MDRCGHVFCLPCVLALFQHSHSKPVLCPLCHDIEITLSSLKRVLFRKNKNPKIGDTITFNLLVKNKNDVAPRIASKISKLDNDLIPNHKLFISTFSAIAFDLDNSVVQSIEKDITSLNVRYSQNKERIDEAIYEKTLSFLDLELDHFQNEILLSDEPETKPSYFCPEEWFNVLEYNKDNSSESKLFYQCHACRYGFLDDSDANQVLERAFSSGKTPPMSIRARIVSMHTETMVTDKNRAMNHIFPGVRIRRIKVNLAAAVMEDIDGSNLRALQRHKNELIAAAKQLEEFKQRVAQQAIERRHVPGRILRVNNYQEPAKLNIITKKKHATVADGFNTCTLGLECVAPDDDYPHAENCVHFNSEAEFKDENKSAEKCFGLLRRKLNVFYPEEICDFDDDPIKPIQRTTTTRNCPPEIILIDGPPIGGSDCKMDKYVVKKICGTQHSQKLAKRLAESLRR